MEQGWFKWIISQEKNLGVEEGKYEREAEPQSPSSPGFLSPGGSALSDLKRSPAVQT